jgi:hypothetical protein
MALALGFALGTVFWLGALGVAIVVALQDPGDTDPSEFG